MTPYSSKMKICATCDKWGGPRSVNATRSVVSTQSSSTRGECLGGGHNHQMTPATATCSKFARWPALR